MGLRPAGFWALVSTAAELGGGVLLAADGRLIAFERSNDVIVMRPDGTDQRVLASDAVAGSPPTWAPDG